MIDFASLPSCAENGDVHVVVEAPRGALAKTKWSPKLGAFELAHATMFGVVYPYDFGFIPSTKAEDGDPIDAMVLFDAPTWPGVIIRSRLVGVVRLVQRKTDDAPLVRNDRLIAVPSMDQRVRDVGDLAPRVREELEEFFLTAALTTKKHARIEGWAGPDAAHEALDRAARAFAQAKKSRSSASSSRTSASPK